MKDIIQDFFDNATPEQLKEIDDAFNIEIENDITLEEYLEKFDKCYEVDFM